MAAEGMRFTDFYSAAGFGSGILVLVVVVTAVAADSGYFPTLHRISEV
jgi:hypothetical protein